MIKQGQRVRVRVRVCESHYHVRPTLLLIYSCLPPTDIRSGTLEYFLDEHVEKCSINIFLASYPSCEVVSAWYRLLPVSCSVSRVVISKKTTN